MKLGERLIEMGALTQGQLDEALSGQLIHGGHLGTCLLELQFVDEHILGQLLSEVFKVQYATPDKFLDLPESVVGSLTPELVEKHQAVPFALGKTTLQIAIVDPSNFSALEEISFAASKRLEPWVAPEARIFAAMERYYNIPRRLRYVTISRGLDRPDAVARAKEPPPPLPPDLGSAPESADPSGFSSAVAAQEQPSIDPTPPVAPAVSRDPEPLEMELAAHKEIIENLDERLTEALCGSDTPAQLAEAVLDYASRGLPRCMLFSVRFKTATLLHTKGLTIDPERKANLSLSVTSDLPFKLLIGDDHYRGPVPSGRFNQSFYSLLDIEVPSEILLLPGHVDDRLEVVLYGDGGTSGKMEGDTQDYRKLVRNLAMGLKMVYLKDMIRSL